MDEYELQQYSSELEDRSKQTKDGLKSHTAASSLVQRAKDDVGRVQMVDSSKLQFSLDEAVRLRNTTKILDALDAIFRPLQDLQSRATLPFYAPSSSRDSDPYLSEIGSKLRSKLDDLQVIDRTLWSQYGIRVYDRREISSFTIPPEDVKKIKDMAGTLGTAQKNIVKILDDVAADISSAKQRLEQDVTEINRLRVAVQRRFADFKEEKENINKTAINLGLPAFCITVVVLFMIPAAIFFSKHASSESGSADVVGSIFKSGILVEINTVLLLTMTILILGLANKIQGEVLGTLLGGISGYVLNRFRSGRRDPDEGQETPNPTPKVLPANPQQGNPS